MLVRHLEYWITNRVKAGILILLGMLCLAMLSTAAPPTEKQSRQDRPNIIFVLVDDLGWTDINSFDPLNRDFYETPNIDRLARQGMTFTQAYSNAANCSPSRAAIMSGQYYPHQPIYHVGSPGKGRLIPANNADALPLEKRTIAEALSKEGYETGFIGKWHIGNPPKTGPQQQGFDINIGGYNAGNPRGWEGEYFKPNNNPYINDAEQGEYLTDYLTRKARGYINAHQNSPFYLQLSYYTVHSPYQAPKHLVKKYDQKEGAGGHDDPTYGAMIESLDRNVGKLMKTLKTLGIAENTIVIFFSDNGGVGGYEFLGHPQNNVTDNSPLKGGKTTYYEGGVRVPLIVRWPAMIAHGTQSEEPVIGIDFYPTLLDAAGIARPENYQLDGKSLLPLFKDADAHLVDRPLYWHFPGYPNNVWRTGPVSVIRKGPWKLMKYYEEFYDSGDVKLYNVNEDISEQHEVGEEYPKVRDKLQTQLQIWLESNNAPTPKVREGKDTYESNIK